jgi:hypothetical protein
MLRTGKTRLAATVFLAAGLALAVPSTAFAAAEPTATVTPAVDLVSGQEVQVSVAGYAAGEAVFAAQCAGEADHAVTCNWAETAELTVDGSGVGAAPVTVQATFDDAGQTVDCRTVANGCFIVTFNAAETASAFASIAFAAS